MKSLDKCVTEPGARRITFSNPRGVDVRAIAKQEGVSPNALLRKALLEYLERTKVTA